MENKIVRATELHRAKVAPELHLHVAATLVSHGDHTSLNPEERKDRQGEVAQFALVIEPKWMGKLRRCHVDQAFKQFRDTMLQRLRAHGVMAQGE
jgi:hypothetical protein